MYGDPMEASSSRGTVSVGSAPALYVTGWRAEESVAPDRVFVIGRSPAADIPLDADSRRFSRRCVELRFESRTWLMSNVSGANVVPYTSGALHSDLAPGTTVVLDRPEYTLYFHVGDTVLINLRLENLADPADPAEAASPSPGDHTVVYPELTARERAVAAAVLEPLFRDPTLGISSIRSDRAAAALLGCTPKAVEHLVTSMRKSFLTYEGGSAEHRGDRYRLFDFLRRSGIVTPADLGRIVRFDA